MQGMGHAYARMKPREWKWLDVAQRLKKVGVDRDADQCGKKWDNLMQQFKKVHRFQDLSGKQDFFQLSGKERTSKGFNFNMDRAVYDEILGSTAKNHTINPKNVVDIGAPGGVRLPSASFGDPESVGDRDSGAGKDEDYDGSTKGSSQTTGGPGSFGKRKSTRQQTFEAMMDCMDKHRSLMASTMESNSKHQCSIAIRQCEAFEAEVELQKQHYAASDEVSRLICNALMEIAKAIRERKRAIKLEAGVSSTMLSRGSGRGKSAANLAVGAAVQEKKGRHVSNKKRKIVAESPSLRNCVVDEEWVPEEVATQDETDFEDSNDEPLKRKSTRRAAEGEDAERRGGGLPAIVEDDVIDVNVATAGRGGGGVMSRNNIARPAAVGRVAHTGGGARAGGAAAGGVFYVGEGARAGGAAAGGAAHAGEGAKAGDVAGAGEDDGALVIPTRQQNTREGIEVASKLWVDGLRFWNETKGIAIVRLIMEACGYLVVVARGVPPPVIRRSIVLPHTSIPQQKLADESELNAVKERAMKVQGIALRVIHDWVFKSASRPRGYHTAYQYALNHVATDIAHAMWMGEDWQICVSPMVVHFTLEMDMKLPLWFIGADVEDKHEDADLVAYQEASIQRLVGAFTSAVSLVEAMDGGRVSYERLKTIADAMRIMLAATMWLMRMVGDDHRAHYDAWVFVQLTTKPTLVASMHRAFDARRHIVQAATIITDKCGETPHDIGRASTLHPRLGVHRREVLTRRHVAFPDGGKKAGLAGHRPPGGERRRQTRRQPQRRAVMMPLWRPSWSSSYNGVAYYSFCRG
ncbi:hypothetical protein CBR_g36520 [Chara braunii]|uniref:Myb/SANT-like DNA-binding domain-containing protein n=1 Tax=Chara braunii TaxID=69332 RepID=A0A388LL63_CHABU|nr:hypothetical protein CBR_g36520 [Chara braunii]|eukprot:GBG82991.1 hypothetical protein CBR_g36520 [Chara braunii]